MGRIAQAWDQMTDQQKVDELRAPTVTRVRRARASKERALAKEFVDSLLSKDFIDDFGTLLVQVRRKAMRLKTLEQRAALVDRQWAYLNKGFRDAGIRPNVIATLRRCLISETISWPWFGQRTTYPAGQGE
jgi:hypothetical protein